MPPSLKFLSVLSLFLATTLVACSQAPRPPKPPFEGKAILTVQATGDQVYTWDATTNTWKFSAPDATFSGQGISGKHSKGPTWQAHDGSSVVGKVIETTPSPRADSIPWLALEVTTHTGTGVLSPVTHLQRFNTVGGKAPTTPGTRDGQEARVHYTATYVFYKAP